MTLWIFPRSPSYQSLFSPTLCHSSTLNSTQSPVEHNPSTLSLIQREHCLSNCEGNIFIHSLYVDLSFVRCSCCELFSTSVKCARQHDSLGVVQLPSLPCNSVKRERSRLKISTVLRENENYFHLSISDGLTRKNCRIEN